MPDDLSLELQRLMQQFQPSEEDKERARRERLLAMGFGLLGARKGQEFDAIGRAGLFGQGVYNDTLNEGPRQRAQAMQSAGQALTLKQQMDAMQQSEAQRQANARYAAMRGGGAQPSQPSQPSPTVPANQFMPTSTAALTGGATAPNPQAPPASAPQLIKPHPRRAWLAQQLEKANFYRNDPSGRLVEYGDKLEAAALEKMPKQKGTRVAMLNGKPVTVIEYDDGVEEVSTFQPAPDVEMVGAGGNIVPYDKRTQTTLGAGVPVTNTPAQEAAIRNAEAQLGVSRGNLAVAQAAERRAADTAREGKWNTDFDRGVQVGPGGVSRPIIDQAGTPLAPKGSEQLANMKRSAVDMADRVLAMTSEAKAALDAGGTGTGTVMGAATRNIPGTPAYDLKTKLESIKANLGFEQLQALRNASPTGGALGAVSEQENRLLQSTIASLDPNQSDAMLRKQIAKVEHHLQRVRQLMAGQNPGPQAPDPGAPAQQQRTGTIGGAGWSAVRVSP